MGISIQLSKINQAATLLTFSWYCLQIKFQITASLKFCKDLLQFLRSDIQGALAILHNTHKEKNLKS